MKHAGVPNIHKMHRMMLQIKQFNSQILTAFEYGNIKLQGPKLYSQEKKLNGKKMVLKSYNIL